MMLTPASELFHLRLAIGCAFYTPPEILGAGIRLVLDERAGDVKGWSGNFAAIDPIPQVDALLERTTEIARAGDSGHEQLPRGCRHDLAAEARGIGFVPMRIVTVTKQDRVDVAIPETRQHIHAFGGNDFGIGRYL